VLNYIIKMISEIQFSASTKGMSEGQVRPVDPRDRGYPQGQGRGYADPHEGRIGLGLKKIYLSTLMTRPSTRPDPQFNQV